MTSNETDSEDNETDTDQTNDWTIAETPTSKELRGVVQTANGPYAVGADGVVLHRNNDVWEIRIDAGPAAKHSRLTTVDVTSDEKRIWFAGSSGVLGMYDTETETKYDYSAPVIEDGDREVTSTWEAIAITGEQENERMLIANGSGEVLPARFDDDGCPQYGEVVKPGGGSTLPALDFGGDTAYVIDTSNNVFEQADDEWTDIGIRNAEINFFDLHATGDSLLIVGAGGLAYRYDRACDNWTPINVGEVALHGVDSDEDRTVAVGTNGHVYQRTPQQRWTQVSASTESDLRSVALGDIDVAVGANGDIVER